MEDPKQRLTTCISTAELERRWKATREMMRERKLDYLVADTEEGAIQEDAQSRPVHFKHAGCPAV